MLGNLIYTTTDEFDKDFKALSKRFIGLDLDIAEFKQAALYIYHELGKNNGGFFPIAGLGINDPRFMFIKVKKFSCRALKSKGAQSGIRVIYCYDNQKNTITFIEMYFKQDQTDCDYKRIKTFYTTIK